MNDRQQQFSFATDGFLPPECHDRASPTKPPTKPAADPEADPEVGAALDPADLLQGVPSRSPGRRKTRAASSETCDPHLSTAMRLSEALKEAHERQIYLHRRKRSPLEGRVTLNERDEQRIGNAICDHLLASLRAQVHTEGNASGSDER